MDTQPEIENKLDEKNSIQNKTEQKLTKTKTPTTTNNKGQKKRVAVDTEVYFATSLGCIWLSLVRFIHFVCVYVCTVICSVVLHCKIPFSFFVITQLHVCQDALILLFNTFVISISVVCLMMVCLSVYPLT